MLPLSLLLPRLLLLLLLLMAGGTAAAICSTVPWMRLYSCAACMTALRSTGLRAFECGSLLLLLLPLQAAPALAGCGGVFGCCWRLLLGSATVAAAGAASSVWRGCWLLASACCLLDAAAAALRQLLLAGRVQAASEDCCSREVQHCWLPARLLRWSSIWIYCQPLWGAQGEQMWSYFWVYNTSRAVRGSQSVLHFGVQQSSGSQIALQRVGAAIADKEHISKLFVSRGGAETDQSKP